MSRIVPGLPAFAALLAIAGCTSAPAVPEPAYVATFKGDAGAGSMTLLAIRTLPREPSSGWLNTVEADVADAKFHARRRRPQKFEVAPGFVAFQTEKKGPFPAGHYSWKGDELTICMLTMTAGAVDERLAFRGDYDLCATMVAVTN